MKQAFRDLETFGIRFEDNEVGNAMIDGTNLDSSTKLHFGSVASTLDDKRKLIPKHVAGSIKWLMAQDAVVKVLQVNEANEEEPDCEHALWVQRGRFTEDLEVKQKHHLLVQD